MAITDNSIGIPIENRGPSTGEAKPRERVLLCEGEDAKTKWRVYANRHLTREDCVRMQKAMLELANNLTPDEVRWLQSLGEPPDQRPARSR